MGTKVLLGEKSFHLRRALAILHEKERQYNERLEQYERECREYAADGYRPHYCLHGVNLWTDYDNICGWCEEGEPTRLDFMAEALWNSKKFSEDVNVLLEAMALMHKVGVKDIDLSPAITALRRKYGIPVVIK